MHSLKSFKPDGMDKKTEFIKKNSWSPTSPDTHILILPNLSTSPFLVIDFHDYIFFLKFLLLFLNLSVSFFSFTLPSDSL